MMAAFPFGNPCGQGHEVAALTLGCFCAAERLTPWAAIVWLHFPSLIVNFETLTNFI